MNRWKQPNTGLVWLALTSVVTACNAGDLSAYLSSGRCDDEGRCARGYECDTKRHQCVAAGSLGAAGATGRAGESSADAGTSSGHGGRTTSRGGSAGQSSGGTIGSGGRTASGGASAGQGSGDAAGDGGIAPDSGGTAGDGGTTPEAGGTAGVGGTTPEAGGTAGEGPVGGGAGACDGEQTLCDGSCVSVATDPNHCQSCGNTCEGEVVSLVCGDGGCGCGGDDARCGETGSCEPTGLCSCGGVTCVRGEVCQPSPTGAAACFCDGNWACTAAQTCCLGSGCVDLSGDKNNCGACGRVCPAIFDCITGECACRNKASCDVGGGGKCTSGLCVCDGTVCAPGQRCVAPGVCGD